MKTNQIFQFQLPSMAAGLILASAAHLYAEPSEVVKKAEKGSVTQNDAKTDGEAKSVAANGKVFSVEPEVLSVVTEGSPTPLRFSYDKNTPYVDEDGKPVAMEL